MNPLWEHRQGETGMIKDKQVTESGGVYRFRNLEWSENKHGGGFPLGKSLAEFGKGKNGKNIDGKKKTTD